MAMSTVHAYDHRTVHYGSSCTSTRQNPGCAYKWWQVLERQLCDMPCQLITVRPRLVALLSADVQAAASSAGKRARGQLQHAGAAMLQHVPDTCLQAQVRLFPLPFNNSLNSLHTFVLCARQQWATYICCVCTPTHGGLSGLQQCCVQQPNISLAQRLCIRNRCTTYLCKRKQHTF